MTPTQKSDLLLAILAMDSYNQRNKGDRNKGDVTL